MQAREAGREGGREGRRKGWREGERGTGGKGEGEEEGEEEERRGRPDSVAEVIQYPIVHASPDHTQWLSGYVQGLWTGRSVDRCSYWAVFL